MSYSDKNNPFYGERGEDYGFGRSSNRGGNYGGGWDDREISDEDFGRPISRGEQAQMSMNRQMDSTQRALASIYESERMGIATAEELVHQGEQLDNVEQKLDRINEDLTASQRHINSIKSVFGGIKNWWTSKKEAKGATQSQGEPEKNDTATRAQLRQAVEEGSEKRDMGQHPGLRIRSEDTRGFGADDTDGGWGASGGATSGRGQYQSQRLTEYDEQLDKNLDMMSDGMARLKGLAMGLGTEIGTQNDQIDRINIKADQTNLHVQDKNTQIRNILYK